MNSASIDNLLQSAHESVMEKARREVARQHEFDCARLVMSDKARVVYALKRCDTKVDAAKMLGVDERTLFRKIKKYNLNTESNGKEN